MSDPASLLVAWQLKHKIVLIVGGGDVASGRLQSVLSAGAVVRLVAPSSTANSLHPLVTRLIDQHPTTITHYDRHFIDSDLASDLQMVLTAIDDVETSQRIARLCRERRIPVNAADIPSSCDFYFGSQITRGPLQILVSTNGKGPKLASLVRQRLEAALPDRVQDAIENVGTLRVKLRSRAPGIGGPLSQKRMRWMSDLCTHWSLEQLAQLDEASMDKVLDEGWEHARVPSFSSVVVSGNPSSNGRPRFLTVDTVPRWLSPFLSGLFTGLSIAFLYSKKR